MLKIRDLVLLFTSLLLKPGPWDSMVTSPPGTERFTRCLTFVTGDNWDFFFGYRILSWRQVLFKRVAPVGTISSSQGIQKSVYQSNR